jgi:sarcosine oxidase subunit gamma
MPESAARVAPIVPETAWLRPLPPAARFILHGDAQVRARAADAWQTPFSAVALRALQAGSRATLWLGPDEYLLIGWSAADAGPDGAAALAEALEQAIGDMPHALVDVSHRQIAVEVHGANAAAILNGACPLDLDLAAFPVGMCTRTVFAKADIVLWRSAEQCFRLEVWRSFANYVTGLLAVIAKDY